MYTLIATFDEDGEILAWVAAPNVTQNEIVHSQGDLDEIRTYGITVENLNPDIVEDALDLLAQFHAVDAKGRGCWDR